MSYGFDANAKGKRDLYAQDAQLVAAEFGRASAVYERVVVEAHTGSALTEKRFVSSLEAVAANATARDRVVVFFSLHGALDSKGSFRLFVAGSKRGVAGDALVAALRPLRCPVVLFVDTCSAGALKEGNPGKRLTLVAACRKEEESAGRSTAAGKPHGYFTQALIEALRGDADANADGVVSVREAARYLPDRASTLAAGHPQNAVVDWATQLKTFTLCSALPREPERRNPFGVRDVASSDDAEVGAFEKSLGLTDAPGAPDPSLAGTWKGRWRSTPDGAWSNGDAWIRIRDDLVFVLYQDAAATYLIEARRKGKHLVGRFVNQAVTSDTAPWIGEVTGPRAIRGEWPGGVWNFSRETASAD